MRKSERRSGDDFYLVQKVRDEFSKPSKQMRRRMLPPRPPRRKASSVLLQIDRQEAAKKIGSLMKRHQSRVAYQKDLKKWKNGEEGRIRLFSLGVSGSLFIILDVFGDVAEVRDPSSAFSAGVEVGDKIIGVSKPGRGGAEVCTWLKSVSDFYNAVGPQSAAFVGTELTLHIVKGTQAKMDWLKDTRSAKDKIESGLHRITTVSVTVEDSGESSEARIEDITENLKDLEEEGDAEGIVSLLYTPELFALHVEGVLSQEMQEGSLTVNSAEAHAAGVELLKQLLSSQTFSRKEAEKIFFQADEHYNGVVSHMALYPHLRMALVGKVMAVLRGSG